MLTDQQQIRCTPFGPGGLTAETDYEYRGYDGPYEVTVYRNTDADAAELVTSHVGGGMHVLLVDIDHPAQLYVDADGATWLHVDVDVSARRARRLRRRLERVGVICPGGASKPAGAVHRARRLSRAADTLVDMTSFDGGYGDLFASALLVTAELDDAGSKVAYPDGGVWLALRHDHLLVDSRTPGHHHLLGSTQMPQDNLRFALRALARAGIADRQWVKLTRRRGWAILQRPQRHPAAS